MSMGNFFVTCKVANITNYMIYKQDVAAGFILFLRSEDTISGSSVSTALAAGVCSLILTCDRLANLQKKYVGAYEDDSSLALVKRHHNIMQSSNGSRLVLLEKLAKSTYYVSGKLAHDRCPQRSKCSMQILWNGIRHQLEQSQDLSFVKVKMILMSNRSNIEVR